MSAAEWKMIALEEAIEFRNGKSPPDRRYTGLNPIFGGNGIIGYTEKSNSDFETIAVGRVGAYCGNVYYYKGKCWVTDNAIIGKINSSYDGLFLFYLLKMIDLNSYRSGSSQPLINQSILNSIQVKIPPLPTQTRIAAILSALDDKIELNRRTNVTLEATAQVIFKEWFVDFRFPGATGEMKDSELGAIPKGWGIGRIGDLVTISSGKGLKKDQLKDDGFPVLGANGRIGFSERFLYNEELILTGRVGTLGTFQLVNYKVWISDNVLILKPIDKVNYHYVYFWMKTIDFANLNRGSTQPLVTKTDLENQPVIIPENALLHEFNRVCRSMFMSISTLIQQETTLSQIRDILLPKLMSGEIEV
jgi:type I restriction enzyme S subunit